MLGGGGGGGGGSCAARRCWILIKLGDMLLLQTTLPVTMTTNRNFPSSTLSERFSTRTQPFPPLPFPPLHTPASLPPARQSLGSAPQSMARVSGARLVT